MIAAAVTVLQLLSCLGFGALGLRALGYRDGLGAGEHVIVAFALGFGILGWLIFPLGLSGMLSQGPLAVLLSVGALGSLLLRRSVPKMSPVAADAGGRILLALLAVVVVFDFLEGIAPPADTDSLAYHFANIKRFIAAGRVEFIPFPIEGAVPMLVQMTYAPVLSLGGEQAMTLWTMSTGWAAGVMLFVLCRRHLTKNWSLAVTLIFLTTPTVVYGAGAGQVEVRNALFVMMAALAAARALESDDLRFAALAGLGAGLYAGAKYPGLLFVAACGTVLVMQRRWLTHGAIFGVAALVAAAPWYVWNGIHTGDPVFPALFQWFGDDGLAFWNKAHDLVFKAQLAQVENPLPHSPIGLLVFPFSATLGFGAPVDAGRVGFGPYGLLILPFVIAGTWRLRTRIRHSRLLPYALMVIIFYVLWFFVGGSQRIRHLLPILPLFLICITAAAERWAANSPNSRPLVAAVSLSLLIQLGVHGLYTLNYLKHLIHDEDREAFFARTVIAYGAVPWINANLTADDRLFHRRRQLRYFLDVPTVIMTYGQGLVEIRPGKVTLPELHDQLRKAGITHIMLTAYPKLAERRYVEPWASLHRAGCLKVVHRYEGFLRSRTLPTLSAQTQIREILKVAESTCPR